ncbi:MAG TPA: AI-2E family transporter [Methanothrix sp.]|nr:AI-2E family transporter [Methanothrix sp.]HPJ84380.1 AI-2E family transporter [Methanothrix sp.]
MDSKNRFLWMSAAILAFAVVGVVYVTKDFITTILLSFFFAYVLHPVYSRLFGLTGKKRISALLSISIIFLIFLVFVLSVINALATEVSNLSLYQESINETASKFADQTAGSFFDWTRAFAEDRAPEAIIPYVGDLLDQAEEQIGSVLAAPASLLAPEVVPRVAKVVTGLADWIAKNLPILMAQFGVAILLTYYLLVDGVGSVEEFLRLMPERATVRRFLLELTSIYNSLFNVYLINSLLTGLIAAFGYLLIGVPYPFLWGMVTAVFALMPLIGTSAVYVPMALYYLVIQDYLRVAALLIFGTVFLNIIPENILRPALAKAGAAIHPAVTLLAFAAPIFVIGVMGVIVGPALYGFVLAAYRTRLHILEEEAGVVTIPPRGEKPSAKSSFLSIEGLRRLGLRARGFVSWLTRGRL